MERFKELFSDKKFYKTLFILALPIVIQNLLMTSLNMADTLMVGALGDIPVAAVGIGNQVSFLVQLFMVGIAGGCSVFVAQFWGKKDKKNIKKVVGLGIISSLVVGLIGTLVVLFNTNGIARLFSNDLVVIAQVNDYLKVVVISYILNAVTLSLAYVLRSMEDAKTPMIISAIAVLTNVVLNYIFIFGKFGIPAMGVKGAAIATVIARVVECILLIWVASRNEVLNGKFKEFISFDKKFSIEVYKSIIPILLNDVCWGLGNFLYSIAYGQIGTEAMASVQICTNIQNLFMVLCMSLASASLVIIGNQVGSGREDKAKKYTRKITSLSFLMGIVIAILVILLSGPIIGLFNVSEEVKNSSILMLNIFTFIAPIRIINIVLIVGAFRGGGDASYALKLESSTMWLIGVPLAFIGAMLLNLKVYQVVLLVSIEEIVKFIFTMLRLKSGKWIKSVITNIEEVEA
ncbi:MATE family efflux transporter [Clostridium mediterraneense]|uniref:MATE family efflux transporter n=1 Tax=Clostridium mediterraneense TaxID=1805472 RepID=UPI000836E1F6|nr:MATE family efflux transporter [Clostridium mediterraneense]